MAASYRELRQFMRAHNVASWGDSSETLKARLLSRGLPIPHHFEIEELMAMVEFSCSCRQWYSSLGVVRKEHLKKKNPRLPATKQEQGLSDEKKEPAPLPWQSH
eukprot:s5489_g5.t1